MSLRRVAPLACALALWVGCQLPPGAALAPEGGSAGAGGTAGALGVDAAMDVPQDVDDAAAAEVGADGVGGSNGSLGSPFSTGVCPTPVAIDPLVDERAACTFTRGAMTTDTLPLTPAQRAAIPIKHVVVLMKENRSFDHVLGGLHTMGQPDADPIPASFSNLDNDQKVVTPYRLDTTCVNLDPGHQWAEMHRQTNHGAMDGFVVTAADSTASDGHFALGTYTNEDLPFYYWLASTFALNQRHFPSVLSGTFPNRLFLLLGTADGVPCSFCGPMAKPTTPSIFNSLDRAGVPWAVYTDSAPFDGTLGWTAEHRGVRSFPAFLSALKDGTLPPVSFVDSIGWVEDEHPTADLQVGEAWTRTVYQALVESPLWPSTAAIWTYDEAGGFFDHVPPPTNACVARPGNPEDAPFVELGIRVPLVVISPWARPHYVSNVVQEHTAITRFIETVFDLPALTSRDANSPALLDLFDFGCAPALLHPPAAPRAGTEGCHGEIILSTDEATYRSAPPQAIKIKFRGSPGPDAHDRIALYRYPRMAADVPSDNNKVAPLAWRYIGGGQTADAAPAMGEVTLDGGARAPGTPWPLPPGLFIVHYLPAAGAGVDGFQPSASTLVQVTP